MFSLSQYIYCSMLLFTHTHREGKKKKRKKSIALIILFLLQWITEYKQRIVWRWKQRPIIRCNRQHQYLVFRWVVHSHILKDGQWTYPTLTLPISTESECHTNENLSIYIKKKKKKKRLLWQNLERMEDSGFLHLLSYSPLPLLASPISSHVLSHPPSSSVRKVL